MNLVICDSNRCVCVGAPLKAELTVHYNYVFLTTRYTCLMSHSFHINKPFNFFPLLHNSNNIWWQVQLMKLHIMQLCSFFQFSITFSHKSLRTNQHFSQTQSTVYSQCHRPSVTPTTIKILHKQTHTHTHLHFN